MAGGTLQSEDRSKAVRSSVVTTYTALMILLLAFFILLNSLGRVEEARLEAIYQSLKGAFGFREGAVSPLGGALAPSPEAGTPLDRVESDYLFLRGLSREQGLDQDLAFLRSGPLRTVVINAGFLFAPGSVELSQRGADLLRQVAQVLGNGDYPVSLLGHTDEAPPPEGAPDNFALSGGRALSVLRQLAELGVRPQRLAAYGLAGNRPLVPNTNARNRALNNRVELVMDASDPRQHLLQEQAGPRQFEFRGFTFDLTPEGR